MAMEIYTSPNISCFSQPHQTTKQVSSQTLTLSHGGLVDTEGVRDHVTKARRLDLPHVNFFDAAFEKAVLWDPLSSAAMARFMTSAPAGYQSFAVAESTELSAEGYEEGLKDSVQQRINKMTLGALACSSAGEGRAGQRCAIAALGEAVCRAYDNWAHKSQNIQNLATLERLIQRVDWYCNETKSVQAQVTTCLEEVIFQDRHVNGCSLVFDLGIGTDQLVDAAKEGLGIDNRDIGDGS
eukprot:s304_g29.t1